MLDAELMADLGERHSLLVEVDRCVDLCGSQDALTPLNTVAVQSRPNSPAVDAEFTSELQHVAASLILIDQVSLFRIGEAALRLERFGWLNAPIIRVELPRVSREQALQGLIVLRIVS